MCPPQELSGSKNRCKILTDDNGVATEKTVGGRAAEVRSLIASEADAALAAGEAGADARLTVRAQVCKYHRSLSSHASSFISSTHPCLAFPYSGKEITKTTR